MLQATQLHSLNQSALLNKPPHDKTRLVQWTVCAVVRSIDGEMVRPGNTFLIHRRCESSGRAMAGTACLARGDSVPAITTRSSGPVGDSPEPISGRRKGGLRPT